MAKNNSKKGMSRGTAVEIGAGVLAAAAAAGAGYYFYGDKNAKKHRAAASKWAKDMKADVMREAKKLKKIDQKKVAVIVNRASAVYAGARSIDAADVRAAAQELKKHWREVQREIGGAAATAKKSAKSAAKKMTKKTSKKKDAKKAKKAAPKKAAKKAKKAAKRR